MVRRILSGFLSPQTFARLIEDFHLLCRQIFATFTADLDQQQMQIKGDAKQDYPPNLQRKEEPDANRLIRIVAGVQHQHTHHGTGRPGGQLPGPEPQPPEDPRK